MEFKSTRAETAKALKIAGAMHFSKRGYAVNEEVGLLRRGRLRADLYCLSFKNTVIVEVKSCWSDFKTDNDKRKWQNYLDYANQFYFLSTFAVIKRIKKIVPKGIGLIYLDPNTGHLKVYQNSKKRKVEDATTVNMVFRCAYRGAKWTRLNTVRYKVFIIKNDKTKA